MSIVTAENYQETLAQLWSLAFFVEEAPLGEMLAAAEHADTVGAFVDPTLYRDKMRALGEDIEMLRALGQVKAVMTGLRRRKAERVTP